MDQGEIVNYSTEMHSTELLVDTNGRSVWASASDISDIFECSLEEVQIKIDELFANGVVDETSKITTNTEKYNLDVILAIGFTLDTKKSVQFQRWASDTLSGFLENGYAIDKSKLEGDPDAVKRLADEIREIRLSEKEQYEAIKAIFKASANDYDANSEVAREFFATVQNKFYYAVTQKTAAQIKIERAEKGAPDFGVKSKKSRVPTRKEAQVAKNYLDEDELYLLRNIAEQWMLYAQGNAMRGKQMTMAELLHRVHQLLEFNGHPVMWEHPGGTTAKQAEKFVDGEYDIYSRQLGDSGSPLPGP